METKKKKIEVTAVFHSSGEVQPLQFTWQDRTFRVQGMGRHWQKDSQQHFLVMAEGERMFELVFAPAESCWYMGKQPPNDWSA